MAAPEHPTRKAGKEFIEILEQNRIARPIACRHCVKYMLLSEPARREADWRRNYRVSCTDRGPSHFRVPIAPSLCRWVYLKLTVFLNFQPAKSSRLA